MAYDPIKYLENKEKISGYQKAYRERNREQNLLRLKVWKSANKEKCAALERKRRAAKRGLPTEPYTVQDVLDKYGTNCHICNLEINLTAERRSGKEGWETGLHIDHLISIINGGPDTLENVRPSHGLCNVRKNSRDLISTSQGA